MTKHQQYHGKDSILISLLNSLELVSHRHNESSNIYYFVHSRKFAGEMQRIHLSAAILQSSSFHGKWSLRMAKTAEEHENVLCFVTL